MIGEHLGRQPADQILSPIQHALGDAMSIHAEFFAQLDAIDRRYPDVKLTADARKQITDALEKIEKVRKALA